MFVPESTVKYANNIREFYKQHLRDEIIKSAEWVFRDTWSSYIAEKYMICDREGEHFFEPIRYDMSLHAYEKKPYYDETYIGVIIPDINSRLAVLKITQYKEHPWDLPDEYYLTRSYRTRYAVSLDELDDKELKKDEGYNVEKVYPIEGYYLGRKDILFNKPITIPRKTYEYFEKQLKEYVGIDIDTLKKVFFIISLFEPNIVGYYGENKYEDIYKLFDKYFKDGKLKDSLKRLRYDFINIKSGDVWDDFYENFIATENLDLFGYGVKGIADVVFDKVRKYTEKNLTVFDDNFLIDDYITIDELVRELEERGLLKKSENDTEESINLLDFAIYSREYFEEKVLSIEGTKRCPTCIPVFRWRQMKDGRVFRQRYWIKPETLTRRYVAKNKYEEFGDILRLDADILLKDEKGKPVNPLVENFLKEMEKDYPDIFKTLMPVGSVFTGLYKDIQDKFAVALGERQLLHFGVDKWYKGFKYDEKDKSLKIHSINSVYLNVPSWDGNKFKIEKFYILHDRTDLNIKKNENGEYNITMRIRAYDLTSKERIENALKGLAQHFERLNKALEISRKVTKRDDLHTILDLKRLTIDEAKKVITDPEFDYECSSGECMKDLKASRLLNDKNMNKHLPKFFKKLGKIGDFDKVSNAGVPLKEYPKDELRNEDRYIDAEKVMKYNPIKQHFARFDFTLRKEYNRGAINNKGEKGDELSKPPMITVMDINNYGRFSNTDNIRKNKYLTMNELGEFISNMRNLADRIDINLRNDSLLRKGDDDFYVNKAFLDLAIKSSFFGFTVPLDSKKLLTENKNFIEKLSKEKAKHEKTYRGEELFKRLYSDDMHKKFMKHLNDVLNEKNIDNPLKEVMYRSYKDGIGVLYSALYPFMKNHIENVVKKSFEDGVDRKLTFATSSLATKKGVSRSDEMLDAILITGDLLHSPSSNVDELVENANKLSRSYKKNPMTVTLRLKT